MIREIKLQSDPGISISLHAMKLTNGHFVVSLVYIYMYGDDRQRVWIVDEDGKRRKLYVG